MVYAFLKSWRFGILIFASTLWMIPALPAHAADFGAEIADLEGQVTVSVKGSAAKSAAKGQRLSPGDKVETGLGGEAEILYDDGNLTRLDENSRLLIEKLTVAEGGARETKLRLETGRIKNAVSKLVSKTSRFDVHTETAVAGVTGTPPWVVGLTGAGSAAQTEVDLLGKSGEAGNVFVEGPGGAGRQLLAAGQRTTVYFKMPPLAPSSIDAARRQFLEQRMVMKTPQNLRDLKRMDLDKKSLPQQPGAPPPPPEGGVPPASGGPGIGSAAGSVVGAAGSVAGAAVGAAAGIVAGTEAAKGIAGAAAVSAAGTVAGAAGGAAKAAVGGSKNTAEEAPQAVATGEKDEKQPPQQPIVAAAASGTVETAPEAAAPANPAKVFGIRYALAGGGRHTLMLKSNRTVWAVGYNDDYQLGDATDDDRSSPVAVKGPGGQASLERITSVSAGERHSIALKDDGTVWAWGYNDDYQLGDGTDEERKAPVQVKGPDGKGKLTGIISIAAGYNHNVALKPDGTVWTWGYNDDGQLGDESDEEREAPVQVKGPGGQDMLEGMIAVAAGETHTIALKLDGTVWAWGKNLLGQLGDGTNEDSMTPVLVKGLRGIVAIASGGNHSLAVKDDGTVWAWGENLSGQLGDKSVANRNQPVVVKVLSGIKAVAAGKSHSVALKNDGTVWTWGANNFGQLGINEGTASMRLVPVLVDGLNGVTAIAAGHGHTLAFKADGTTWGWGDNSDGQLGDGSEVIRLVPTLMNVF